MIGLIQNFQKLTYDIECLAEVSSIHLHILFVELT